MTREALQKELKRQQEHLNWIRQSFNIDQSHLMFTKADNIQKLIDEINDDLYQFSNATRELINDALIESIKSQLTQLKNATIVRKKS